MIFAKKILGGCKKNAIGNSRFIRVTYYRNAKSEKNFLEQGLQFIMELKQGLANKDIGLKRVISQRKQDSMLIAGQFEDQVFFNLALADYGGSQEPLFRVEIVGENGMVQYDSSADNAFTVANHQLDYFSVDGSEPDATALLEKVDFLEMEDDT